MIKVNSKNKIILITGYAGFIGASLVARILKDNMDVTIIGIDSINNYYDIELKKYRVNYLEKLSSQSNCHLKFLPYTDIADKITVMKVFQEYAPQIVINLAAQAGVRFSIYKPDIYINSNIIGFYNILEACRHSYDNCKNGVKHLIYASSSSVYGTNNQTPYSIEDKTDTPVSLYAATKKSNELLAHAYSKLYNIPTTGLRFFTVYGPAGRPDMAYFKFTDKFIKGEKIKIFNNGNCKRDFTYIDDIVEGIIRVMTQPPVKKIRNDGFILPPYAIYNIGSGKPESLLNFINILQEELLNAKVLPPNYDFESHKEFMPMQPGDMIETYADIDAFENNFKYRPTTTLHEGLRKFIKWYKKYYNI